MKQSTEWWIKLIMHNCVIHPLLVVSRFLQHKGYEKSSYLIDVLHDATIPKDDLIDEHQK